MAPLITSYLSSSSLHAHRCPCDASSSHYSYFPPVCCPARVHLLIEWHVCTKMFIMCNILFVLFCPFPERREPMYLYDAECHKHVHIMLVNVEIRWGISEPKSFLNTRMCVLLFSRWVGVWQVLRPACHPIDWWHLSNDKNEFACMAPGCHYSNSIRPMNKPSVCFPADKVIAIDLQAARVTIMKSVYCHSMDVEQEDLELFYQWNKFGIDP